MIGSAGVHCVIHWNLYIYEIWARVVLIAHTLILFVPLGAQMKIKPPNAFRIMVFGSLRRNFLYNTKY